MEETVWTLRARMSAFESAFSSIVSESEKADSMIQFIFSKMHDYSNEAEDIAKNHLSLFVSQLKKPFASAESATMFLKSGLVGCLSVDAKKLNRHGLATTWNRLSQIAAAETHTSKEVPTIQFRLPNSVKEYLEVTQLYPLFYLPVTKPVRDIRTISQPKLVLNEKQLNEIGIKSAISIVVHPFTGNIYVTQSECTYITVLSPELKLIQQLRLYVPKSVLKKRPTRENPEEGGYEEPEEADRNPEIDNANQDDAVNEKAEAETEDGQALEELMCDSIAFSQEGHIVVGAYAIPQISIFDCHYNHLLTFWENKWGHINTYNSSPKRIAFNEENNFYVSDPGIVGLQKFNMRGTFLRMFVEGYLGRMYGIKPIHGIAVMNGNILLCLERRGTDLYYHIQDAQAIAQALKPRTDIENNLFVGPDETFGICDCYSDVIYFYKLRGTKLHELRMKRPLSAGFGVNSQLYVLASNNQSMSIY